MGRYEHHFSYNSNLQIFLLYIYLHIKVETFVSFFFPLFLVTGTRHRDRGSVITPLITSISVSGTLSKLH